MSQKERDIINIDDWRVVDDRALPAVDADQEQRPHYANPVWASEMRSAGPGCCFGLSITALIIVILIVLGLCAACWLMLQALGWLVP